LLTEEDSCYWRRVKGTREIERTDKIAQYKMIIFWVVAATSDKAGGGGSAL
jgi:hypothetical protein